MGHINIFCSLELFYKIVHQDKMIKIDFKASFPVFAQLYSSALAQFYPALPPKKGSSFAAKLL